MGWPLSRSTNAAASRALYFLADADFAGDGAAGLAGGFFLAAVAGAAGTRFFLAVMAHLLGRQLGLGQQHARRAAAPGEEDYLDRAATSRQFPTKPRSFLAGPTGGRAQSIYKPAGVARRSLRQRRLCSCQSSASATVKTWRSASDCRPRAGRWRKNSCSCKSGARLSRLKIWLSRARLTWPSRAAAA